MRVPISVADRQTWRVDVAAVATAMSESLGMAGVVKSLGSDRVYQCGQHAWRDLRVDVYLARGLHRQNAAQVAERIPRGIVPPIVFVPCERPADMLWPEPAPTVITLNTIAQLDAGRLAIDGRLIDQVLLRRTRGDTLPNNVFRCRGDYWEVAFDGSEVKLLKNSVGLSYIARLLAEPHKSIPAVSLLAARAGIDSQFLSGSSGEMLNEEGKSEMKKAYSDLIAQRDEAIENADIGRRDDANARLEQLAVELSRRLNVQGKAREESDAERVRKSVSMAVAREIKVITNNLVPLGSHLSAITSGTYFKYAPDREVDWLL
jgi:hypothetical protein